MSTATKRPRTSAVDSFLDAEGAALRESIDANPHMSDAEFFRIVALLEELEPPLPQPMPSAALSREARVAELGRRFDNGQSLWCAADAIHNHRLRIEAQRVETASAEGDSDETMKAAWKDLVHAIFASSSFRMLD